MLDWWKIRHRTSDRHFRPNLNRGLCGCLELQSFVQSSATQMSLPSLGTPALVMTDEQREPSIRPRAQSRNWLRFTSLPLLVKRAVDLAAASVGLILLPPVILLVA